MVHSYLISIFSEEENIILIIFSFENDNQTPSLKITILSWMTNLWNWNFGIGPRKTGSEPVLFELLAGFCRTRPRPVGWCHSWVWLSYAHHREDASKGKTSTKYNMINESVRLEMNQSLYNTILFFIPNSILRWFQTP